MRTMKHFGLSLFLLVISVGYGHAQGVINVQNGNINHFYEDFVVPGHSFQMKLERAYNSKSKFSGMFGNKWGSNFDILFKQTPQGTVEITEFGGGFKTTFSPKNFSQKEINAFVEEILKKVPTASRTDKLKESLKNDAQLRFKLANDYKVFKSFSMDTLLHANDRGPETLKKTKVREFKKFIWIRTFSDGRKEYFNHQGFLVRRFDSNNNYLKLHYDKENRLAKVSDRVGRHITLTYYPNGLVKTVTSPLGKKCEYQYDKKGNLVFAKNDRGYEFKHKYDARFRMEEVFYPKGQKEIMKYDDFNRIVKHEGPEDIKTHYIYDTKGNPDTYFNVTVSKEIGKKPNQVVTVDKYEYQFGKRDNGTSYTYKLATVLDGVRTETTYTPCCGKPISIKRKDKTTRFEYYANGNLKHKTFPNGQMVKLEYDKDYGKVSKVTRANPKLKTTDVTEYRYDKKGNLAFARNKARKISVQLVYDTKGRIRKLVDHSGKEIAFNYNELGKPTKIKLKGVGAIVVSYNASGKITNVKSTGGRKIASEVTGAFQSLLEVIRPAGVSLNI